MPRVRSADAHRRALSAALDLVAERGIDGVTVEEVAARSGVAKTTIYRHWASRQQLLVDAIGSSKHAMPTPNTGDLRADLLGCFDEICDAGVDDRTRSTMLELLAAAVHDAELRRLHAAFVAERERPVRTVLQLAQGRGDLPAGLDLHLAIDLLVGPLLHRMLLRGEPIGRHDLEVVVDTVIAGLRAGLACASLPPSRDTGGDFRPDRS